MLPCPQMPQHDSVSMTPEEWSRIEAIFHDAFERPHADRAAFLDGACAGDSAMRRHVESLIQHAGQRQAPLTPQFLQDVGAALSVEELMAGCMIGHYEILSVAGAGGMGEVYRARDTKLKRDVAVKVMRQIFERSERVRRSEREAEVLASLNHPNIGAHLRPRTVATGALPGTGTSLKARPWPDGWARTVFR